MNDSPEPDSFEKRLRFGCGFVFGGVFAFSIVAIQFPSGPGTLWATVTLAAFAAGFFAMRRGDRFWQCISRWFNWW